MTLRLIKVRVEDGQEDSCFFLSEAPTQKKAEAPAARSESCNSDFAASIIGCLIPSAIKTVLKPRASSTSELAPGFDLKHKDILNSHLPVPEIRQALTSLRRSFSKKVLITGSRRPSQSQSSKVEAVGHAFNTTEVPGKQIYSSKPCNISFTDKALAIQHMMECLPKMKSDPVPRVASDEVGKSNTSLLEIKKKNDAVRTRTRTTLQTSELTEDTFDVAKSSDGQIYLCTTCKLSFIDVSLAREHAREHTDERTFACEQCPRKCKSAAELETHARYHRDASSFLCDFCGKSFGKKSSLVNHRRLHTGEKPFLCPHCGKTFSDRSSMKAHVRAHTGERPFKCETCGKRYTHPSSLKVHSRVHTGERPYQCEICEESFTSGSRLLRHTKRHLRTGKTRLRTVKSKREKRTTTDDLGD